MRAAAMDVYELDALNRETSLAFVDMFDFPIGSAAHEKAKRKYNRLEDRYQAAKAQMAEDRARQEQDEQTEEDEPKDA